MVAVAEAVVAVAEAVGEMLLVKNSAGTPVGAGGPVVGGDGVH